MVAIKKIEKAFEHSTFAKRTLKELKILRLIHHDHVMGIKTIQLPRSRDELDEIYVVSELMETDLTFVACSPQPLSNESCQFFLYQLLRGLKFLHSASILHRDLKPWNLLISPNCDLKYSHFSLACIDLPNLKVRGDNMTDCVPNVRYRAPEVLLTYKVYTKAMDIWSVGCILGEMLLKKPILPGNDAQNQLDLIFDLIGSPTDEDIANIPNQKSKEKVLRMPCRTRQTLDAKFASCNPEAVDLLKRMLIFDPTRRITVEAALNHPYMSLLHFPEDEPTTEPVSFFDFTFEREALTMKELKDKIYEEILLYHFPDRKAEYERQKRESEVILSSLNPQGDQCDSSSDDVS